MKKNMGTTDRVVRVIIVAALVALYATGTVTSLWGTVALVAAGIFTVTSLISFCPIYAIFGVKTCKT
ncbi:YgaP family membrane protein [Roseivirga sp.]|uniref:YgaP family membrane protein n=1 Tax=Roseivirga sp. TaxID=1964215 RepID=UPI003B8E9ADA